MVPERLYILPFDHRATFVKELFGYQEPLSMEQHSRVSKYKGIIWNAFVGVYRKQKDKKSLGILIDEEFGSGIIKKAKKLGVVLSVPAEKSGQRVFDFEYGQDFGKHILKFRPDYAKVLVRYNPDNRKDNKIQLKRLRKINDFCKNKKIGFLFELLVPATDLQKTKNYDCKVRPLLTVKSIKEIRAFGIEPDIWKLEEMPDKRSWQNIINAVKSKNKKNAKIIVLGRAGTKQRVKGWLRTASQFPEIIGFAIGRTIFFQPLESYRDKKITEKQAVGMIAKGFSYFIQFWEKHKR
jgi:5-dehydro-2-deoxygluconokinase